MKVPVNISLAEELDRQNAEKLVLLRATWNEGINSGDAGEVDFAELKREARTRLVAQR